MNAPDLAAFHALIDVATLPALGPKRRREALSLSKLEQNLTQFFAGRSVAPSTEAALRAAALLWHDHLDESHRLSQDLPDSNGSFLHGIMHRREPDYSNAKYWFRQVGRHPAYPEMARQVNRLGSDVLERAGFTASLFKGGAWDPFGFVDLCEQWAAKDEAPARLLQEIQAIEFRVLLTQL